MSVPELRFNEFDESWSQVILDDLAEVERGKFSVRPRNDPRYFGGKMPFVQTGDVTGSDVYLKGFSQTLNEDGIKVSKVFPEDTILITIAANIGDTTITQYPVACPDSVVAIQPKKELTNTIFLKNVIDLQKDFLDSQATQNAQKNINLQVLKPLELIVPSLKEQTKIAAFLSAVDEKISQLTQKHELLSQYKQGMMQKLFSQQIRFKADDGSEFGEWEEKTLIDSVDTNIKWSFTGGPFGSNLKSEDYTELGIRIIQLQNIGDGAFLNDYKIYTSPEKANELLSCNIYPDEILISKMGDPVARCCIVPKHHDRYVMCSDGIRLVVDKQNYSSIFMFYQINYQDFRQSASDVSTGSTRKRIGLSDLKQLPIKVPCLEEQTKIATFLSAIDQKIEVVAQQIEQAKTWKKGLLQQMFV